MSYFERIGPTSFRATQLTGGAWSTTEQHIAPTYGLIVHAIEGVMASRNPGLVLSRLAVEILGVIPIGDVEVTVEVIRPGRTIELVEATVSHAARPVVRARAWFLTTSDTSAVAGGAAPALPHAQECEPLTSMSHWPGDFIRSVDCRMVRPPLPGRATVWVGTSTPLLNEPTSTLARFLSLVDTANGIAVRQDPREWMFPNVDASIHLHRQPVVRDDVTWTGLDTAVIFGAGGVGLTSTVLHDAHGEVGRMEQTLTLRQRQ